MYKSINPVANIFFCDTLVILDSSPDSNDYNLPSAPPGSELKPKCIDTGSTEQLPRKSEKGKSSF